jgi:hypothetical protein
VLGCAIGIVMGIAGGVYSASNADAGAAYNFGYFTSYDDVFRNYDFTSPTESQYNVDWAVTMIFTNNASVGKVENSLVNHGYYANGTTMWARVIDNSVDWVWYGQEGKKLNTCNDYHLRVYADTHDSMLHNPGIEITKNIPGVAVLSGMDMVSRLRHTLPKCSATIVTSQSTSMRSICTTMRTGEGSFGMVLITTGPTTGTPRRCFFRSRINRALR